MKKIFTVLIAVIIFFIPISCTDSNTEKISGQFEEDEIKYSYGPESEIVITEKLTIFPAEFKGNYYFTSGVGAWVTKLNLHADGSFEGEYTDTNQGECGDDYDSTIYVSKFTGKFRIVGKIDEYSYYAVVSKLSFKSEEEEIKDNIRYVYTFPAGLKSGERFVLYTPQTPVSRLDDDFLSWSDIVPLSDENKSQNLDRYGLYNVETGYGFFCFQY